MSSLQTVGALLREWRQRRRLTQLDLAGDAGISTRHLSFVETGRSQPSREMLLHLAEQLDVPLRERNRLLQSAGYASAYPEHPLSAPPFEIALRAIHLVLKGHEPYPALAIDRHWTLIGHNRSVGPFLAGVEPELRQPPINLLRFTLHPGGLATRIANLGEWRAHLLMRLRHQIEVTADPVLIELMAEMVRYPAPAVAAVRDYAGVVVPMELRSEAGTLSFFSTTTVFGTPIDVTLSELAIEAFFPADAATAETLRRITS